MKTLLAILHQISARPAVPLLGIALLLSRPAASRAASVCDELASPQNVLECALDQHPDVVRARAAVSLASQLDAVARQRPNPEINSTGVTGKSLGDTVLNIEANLAHTFELGGKRGSRIEKATAERDATSVGLLRAREETYLSIAKALNRLRQVKLEVEILDEAMTTFSRILKQFKSRPRLGPEQQVSLGIFQLAEGDYRLRHASLDTEQNALERSISLAIGRPFSSDDRLLPKRRTSWPAIADASTPDLFKGSAILFPAAEVKVAEADLSLAQSASWPDLKLGPSWQSQTQGPFTFQTYGINLSFALPLFHANGGGRAYAYEGIARAEKDFASRRREVATERAILVQQYSRATRAISEAPSVREMERKHHNVEVLFQRGVIPSSLVIEAHRQMVDFTKNQHEQELSALEALWRIYILEGRIFEEKL